MFPWFHNHNVCQLEAQLSSYPLLFRSYTFNKRFPDIWNLTNILLSIVFSVRRKENPQEKGNVATRILISLAILFTYVASFLSIGKHGKVNDCRTFILNVLELKMAPVMDWREKYRTIKMAAQTLALFMVF